MEFLKDIVFDDLHLFETSLLGKPHTFHYRDQTVLIIPCYQPVFKDKNNVEMSGNKSFLVFDYVEYYSYRHNLYSKELTEFLGLVKQSSISFNHSYARNCNKLVSLGILDSGIGEISFTIICNRFHIVNDFVKSDFTEINVLEILNDIEIKRHLLFPDLVQLEKLLSEQYNINS